MGHNRLAPLFLGAAKVRNNMVHATKSYSSVMENLVTLSLRGLSSQR